MPVAELQQLVRDLATTVRTLADRGGPRLPAVAKPEVEPAPGDRRGAPADSPSPAPAASAFVPGEIPRDAPREARLGILEQQVRQCRQCRLAGTRRSTVFGEGAAAARVMFIGEGPGADEDRTGRPFVGRSGQLLTRMLAAIGLPREQVFIANIVKCRPPGNRDPLPDETAACRPFLDAQIEAISPDVIVCLGRPSAQTLLNSRIALTALRGQQHKLARRDVLVTYHPSFLLRTPGKKREAWADLLALRKLLADKGLAPPLPEPWWK